MTIEERVKECLMQTWLLPSKCDKLAPLVAALAQQYAEEQVKAERRKILDELERTIPHQASLKTHEWVMRFIDRLRGGGE